MTKRILAAVALLAVVLGAGAIWWNGRGGDEPSGQRPGAAPSHDGDSEGSSGGEVPGPAPDVPPAAELAAAESAPREDSVYPKVGDPGVDALHYALDLTWLPEERTLEGVETVTFRATVDADSFRLDLGAPLTVSALEVDGEPADFEHPDKDLVVQRPVRADQEYTLRLAYSGTPDPVPAPTTRSDFSTTGWTITPTGEVWTMQEPYGAFTWYAVNDQPADKALYDFTITVAAPWTGVANGTMTSKETVDGNTVTSFHLAEPAASYLITIAIGDYAVRRAETAGGVPLTYWALRSQPGAFRDLRFARRAIGWIERKLGPYPFASAGILLTDSESGMETQTLVTLGDTEYARSPGVIVHEMVHQWYGDLVTPTDWRDVWMNEGMTMYLQLVYESETSGRSLDAQMREVASYDQQLRDQAGPPGAYDASEFGQTNIYYCPAVMWHELRRKVGDEEFWRLTREWPRVHAYGNATRDQWFDWVEAETGLELTAFFEAWIMGETTPGAPSA